MGRWDNHRPIFSIDGAILDPLRPTRFPMTKDGIEQRDRSAELLIPIMLGCHGATAFPHRDVAGLRQSAFDCGDETIRPRRRLDDRVLGTTVQLRHDGHCCRDYRLAHGQILADLDRNDRLGERVEDVRHDANVERIDVFGKFVMRPPTEEMNIRKASESIDV